MKKTISLIFISILALSSAYGQGNEAAANKLFVTGALKANAAIKEYENYNVKTALPLLREALASCDKILADYPETNIALSLVSNENLNFGKKKYAELAEKLEKMKAFSVYVDKYGDIGEFLYDSEQEAIREAYKFFYGWREPEYKTLPNKQVGEFFDIAKVAKYPILAPIPLPEAELEKAEIVVENMEDVLAISKEVKTNVALIAFEKTALQYLYDMSVGIADKPNLKQIFEPYMPKIKENISKITLPDERDNGYFILSKIYANMDNSLSVNVALSDIKNEDLRAKAFVYYTDKLIERGKFNNALDLLSLIKDQEIKDSIALEISKQLRATNVDVALQVLSNCADEIKRKEAIVEIGVSVLHEGNKNEIANYLAENVSDLTDVHIKTLAQRLNLLEYEDLSEKSPAYIKALVLGELAVLFSGNQNFAIKLATQMLSTKSEIADKTELVDMHKAFFNAVLSISPDINATPLLSSLESMLSKEDLHKIYLKFYVCSILNNAENAAYLQLLNPKYLPKEYLIVGLLKANKNKKEVLKILLD
ncbi:MAG: hypothetical protein R3Y46_02450 [Opitutales bacterium]